MAELKIISMNEVQSKEVNWLWYPYIPYGKITIIQGDPGEGKTTLALRLAALLSKGEALPYDDTEREPVKIIYQTAEDGLEDTIKPRLEAAEADCTQIKVIDESEAALSMLDERIEKAIIEVGARVVILDPIQAYVGANINMNNAKIAQPIINSLRELVQGVIIKYFEMKNTLEQWRQVNQSLYHDNNRLSEKAKNLENINAKQKAELQDYKLLRKVFGSKQIDDMLKQAKEITQSKQREKRFRNYKDER